MSHAFPALKLSYCPPLDVAALMAFFQARAVSGLEWVDGLSYARTLSVQTAVRTHTGWLKLVWLPEQAQVQLQLSEDLQHVSEHLMAQARAMLDLDADPLAIASTLSSHFGQQAQTPGLRVPGTMNAFELAVRAVLGQQVTVAAARTLTQRLVHRLGEPLHTPWPELTHLFPSTQVLAEASPDVLGQLGIVKQRQRAIQALAQALTQDPFFLTPARDIADTVTALKTLPGIGDWTAQYIAMRALRWPDAFPAGDIAVQKALGIAKSSQAARLAEEQSVIWRPWRSYAVMQLWQQGPVQHKDHTPPS